MLLLQSNSEEIGRISFVQQWAYKPFFYHCGDLEKVRKAMMPQSAMMPNTDKMAQAETPAMAQK
jgi:hypothetical protein